ncbi:hypothetical protein NJ76_12705 [Rhodococcus sp. IITR03]|nr:hypothetical protein NJ76_12705 [Rhodococcus sp. IITR03]
MEVEMGVHTVGGPVTRREVGIALERDGGRVVTGEFDPVLSLVGDRPSEQPAVEVGERARIRAVEDGQESRGREGHALRL